MVPAGCSVVAFEDRIKALEGLDALVSATSSPHYTLTLAQLETVANPPKVAVDLAVPRDIDPACACRFRCYDTDALGTGGPGSPEELAQMRAIVREELDKFHKLFLSYTKAIRNIQNRSKNFLIFKT